MGFMANTAIIYLKSCTEHKVHVQYYPIFILFNFYRINMMQ